MSNRLLAFAVITVSLRCLCACGDGGAEPSTSRPGDAPPASGTEQGAPPPSGPDEAAAPADAEVLDPPASAHGVVEHPELVGETRAAMHARFGPPTRTDTVRIGDGVTEMQIELLNHYPPDEPGNADVEIREDWWGWGGHTLVLWSHRPHDDWVVLETVHFTDDVEF